MTMTTTTTMLPRAPLGDVVLGRAPLVGSRIDTRAPRGFVSPVEARLLMGIPYGDLDEAERRYLSDAQRSPRTDAAVVARSAVAVALAPRGGAQVVDRPFIVAARVDNMTIEQAVAAIFTDTDGRRARMIHFVHPHALNVATFQRPLAEMLARADVVLPDGIGVRLGATILGIAMRHNLNGTDLLLPICRRAVERDLPLVLIGAADGVAERCAANLRESVPGLRTPIVQHGYLDERASAELAARVRGLGRSIVLVGMGTPRQESWAWRWLRDAERATVLTVGGLFDFFSGDVARAPVAWRELGLEWLWRLRTEPRRLAARYLVGNPLFLTLASLQRAGARRR